MCTSPILSFTATIYRDRVGFETHSVQTTWDIEMDALIRLRDDINQLILDGPLKCPVSPYRSTPQRPVSSASRPNT